LEKDTLNFERDKIKKLVAALASQGMLIGTSSWKYRARQNTPASGGRSA